jgi:ferrochelatase
MSNPTTAILLCNLGTPDAPTPKALRKYLAEFLSDHRVVEIPRLIWWPILHGIILRTRPAQSAKKYASIWMKEGSPLKVWSEKQAKALQQTQGLESVIVLPAMRYGSPSIASQLDALKALGIQRVLILSAYPQYSATTTASVVDAVNAWSAKTRALPEFRFINRYFDDAGYIKALASRINACWQQHGKPDKLVLSFHGLPERNARLGDPYPDECHATARLLAKALGLTEDQYLVTFQSRFGKAKWLTPYTQATLEGLARSGPDSRIRRVDVACPGFIADCIETLEEIDMEVRKAFMDAGGNSFHYIPCLNDEAESIKALGLIAQKHLQGWLQPRAFTA